MKKLIAIAALVMGTASMAATIKIEATTRDALALGLCLPGLTAHPP